MILSPGEAKEQFHRPVSAIVSADNSRPPRPHVVEQLLAQLATDRHRKRIVKINIARRAIKPSQDRQSMLPRVTPIGEYLSQTFDIEISQRGQHTRVVTP